jgi:hypothetical protein
VTMDPGESYERFKRLEAAEQAIVLDVALNGTVVRACPRPSYQPRPSASALSTLDRIARLERDLRSLKGEISRGYDHASQANVEAHRPSFW